MGKEYTRKLEKVIQIDETQIQDHLVGARHRGSGLHRLLPK